MNGRVCVDIWQKWVSASLAAFAGFLGRLGQNKREQMTGHDRYCYCYYLLQGGYAFVGICLLFVSNFAQKL